MKRFTFFSDIDVITGVDLPKQMISYITQE